MPISKAERAAGHLVAFTCDRGRRLRMHFSPSRTHSGGRRSISGAPRDARSRSAAASSASRAGLTATDSEGIPAGRLRSRCTRATSSAAPSSQGQPALRTSPACWHSVRARSSRPRSVPLTVVPDVLLVDATGRDHPRRAGLALHLGAVLDVPTVGVTHRPLLATDGWPPDEKGGASPLVLDGEVVGAWLRTRPGTRPLAVQPPGARMSIPQLRSLMASLSRSRTPEPLRLARTLAREARATASRAPA